MKTRFTLTSLALASLMMMGNSAMAAVVSSGTEQYFNVKIKIAGSCEVFTTTSGMPSGPITSESDPTSGTDIDFGEQKAETNSPALERMNKGNAAQGIVVNCSKNTAFKVAMDPESSHSQEGSGEMTGLSSQEKIAYQLYKPTVTGSGLSAQLGTETASTNKWGKDNNALSLTGKGLGTAINIPVFAKIEQGVLADKTPDTYQDRVKVTLTY